MTWPAPAVIISVAALLLSLCSFAYTRARDREQSERWNALNLARFSVSNLQFVNWRSLPADELHTVDWGYADVYTTSGFDAAGVLDASNVRIPVRIVAVHSQHGILETKPTITIAETIAELERRQLDITEWQLKKFYKLVLRLQNIGATPAVNVTMTAQLRDETGILVSKFPADVSESYIGPGDESWIFLEWATRLELSFPSVLSLAVIIWYDDVHCARRLQQFSYKFDRSNGAFRRL